jgi:hypothetical protein
MIVEGDDGDSDIDDDHVNNHGDMMMTMMVATMLMFDDV